MLPTFGFVSRIQSVYCHVHSEEKQFSLYNEILSLLSTLNVKTSTNYVKIKTDIHINKIEIIKVQLCCRSRNRL